jgi:hypothetical protein
MPTLLSKALGLNQKGLVKKASRGSLGSYIVNAPHQYGQPYSATVGVADPFGTITQARQREIVLKTSTAGAAVNTILDFVGGVKLTTRSVDARKKPDQERAALVRDLLVIPNNEDTGRDVIQILARDLLTIGYAAAQVEFDDFGRVAALWPIDAAKLQIDFGEHGEILGYDMIDAHGQPIKGPDGVHAWLPKEVIFFRRDPISSSRYPMSRITQLFSLALLEDLMVYFISGKFTDSNIPYGVYDLGDITEDDLLKTVDIWNTQFESGHRIMLLNSKNGAKWFPFGYHLKDLEAVNLLELIQRKQMEVLGVTDNEMGDSKDVNKSNGYSLSYTFKKRAVEPLLDVITHTLTRFLVWDILGFKDIEIGYEEIDSRDEQLQAQIDDLQLKHGVVSVNQVRNRRGDASIPGGDEPALFTGSAWIPVSMMQAFAQAQLTTVQAEAELLKIQAAMAASGQAGQVKAGVSPPLVRTTQPPERYTTPDGSGSSTPKITLPKPELPQTGTTQAPRGPVQALRNQGVRKEDQ